MNYRTMNELDSRNFADPLQPADPRFSPAPLAAPHGSTHPPPCDDLPLRTPRSPRGHPPIPPVPKARRDGRDAGGQSTSSSRRWAATIRRPRISEPRAPMARIPEPRNKNTCR